MQGIGSFFDKFKNAAAKEIYKYDIVADIIYKNTNQKIDLKDISIKNGILIIRGNQSFKSEIFLKKNKILEQISKKLINFNIIDIK